MAFSTIMHIRVDERMKAESDALFKSMGFDTATAVRMFLAKAINMQGMPFDVSKANAENQENVNRKDSSLL